MVKTVNGLWKFYKQIWNGIHLNTIKLAFNSWKKRCRFIVKK